MSLLTSLSSLACLASACFTALRSWPRARCLISLACLASGCSAALCFLVSLTLHGQRLGILVPSPLHLFTQALSTFQLQHTCKYDGTTVESHLWGHVILFEVKILAAKIFCVHNKQHNRKKGYPIVGNFRGRKLLQIGEK